ncbi:MAG: hypothetical protein IT428_21025 [Planctomycetaceae bacterium]|nr:hypothetical protein [Planctomycetaceae bacterium]
MLPACLKSTRAMLIAAGAFVLGLTGYVTAYYLTVEPFRYSMPVAPLYVPPGEDAGSPRAAAFQDWVEVPFKPIHWIDRRLRRSVWGFDARP